jgi:hypothetical protein
MKESGESFDNDYDSDMLESHSTELQKMYNL